MKLFNDSRAVVAYVAKKHPKRTVAYHYVDGEATLIGIRDEDGDIIEGYVIYIDRMIGKWVLLDNIHADLAVKAYLEYVEEFYNALSAVDEVEDEDEDEDEILGINLDL